MENWINYLTLVLLSIGLFWLVLSDSRRSIVVAYSVVVIIVFRSMSSSGPLVLPEQADHRINGDADIDSVTLTQ